MIYKVYNTFISEGNFPRRYYFLGGAFGVMVIVVGTGIVKMISNPRRNRLYFTLC